MSGEARLLAAFGADVPGILEARRAAWREFPAAERAKRRAAGRRARAARRATR